MYEKCLGCSRLTSDQHDNVVCFIYPDPEKKWKLGNCPMATHIKKVQATEKKINPLKASKRGQ